MSDPSETRLGALAELVVAGAVVVLSGAGLSTESGIPDYRGPTGVMRHTRPMTYQTFVGDAAARQRYWARSHLGWHTIARAVPNTGHRAVTRLQRQDLLAGILTQNVDGLHQASGAREVVELHGNLAQVVCLDCGDVSSRQALDHRLRQANPQVTGYATALRPDGDVELGGERVARFRPVGCLACDGGTLKPDVVFFGETVPPERVRQCYALVERARLLLVLGSSLTVMSGRRFVVRAVRLGIPVAVVNQGPTRADHLATVRVDAPLGMALADLVRRTAELRFSAAPPGPADPVHRGARGPAQRGVVVERPGPAGQTASSEGINTHRIG